MFSFSIAMEPSKGIGLNGTMPWHIKDELKIFKRNTLNKSVIMGRTTVEGLPVALKDRTVYSVSRDPKYHSKFEEVIIISDLTQFLQQHLDDSQEYVICGGASIYRQAYPYCQKGYVSCLKQPYAFDTAFEQFQMDDWDITFQQDYPEFTYYELVRKQSSFL